MFLKFLHKFINAILKALGMSNQTFVDNRNKVQFANALPFGKLVAQSSGSLSVGATSTNSVSIPHSLTTTPSIFGWARVQGDNRWVPMTHLLDFTSSEIPGTHRIVGKIFTNATAYGVFLNNIDAGASYTVDYKIWVFII